jgi:hypothetical protein
VADRPARPEVRVALTRVCLRSGSVLLPLRARGVLPEGAALEAYDPEGQDAWDLAFENGRLHGLAPFFERHALMVNDELLIRPREDGHVVLLARPRARSSARDARAVRRAVEALLAGGPPRTEQELREDHGLADDAPLEAALRREPLLERRAGRWALVGARPDDRPAPAQAERSAPQAYASPRPAASDGAEEGRTPSRSASPETMTRARDAFSALGYRVSAARGGTLRLEAHLGRARVRILARALDDGDAPDWSELLQAVREERADRLALVGDVRDLTRLERPARGARATLWSWDGLRRARDLARTVPIGPLDLMPAFDDGGLHGVGLERFEARVEERLKQQGAFSAVAERLATLRAPALFTVDDLAIDERLPRETIVAELDRMAGPPLQWTERRGPGEYALHQGVAEGLERLETFARSLRERLPDPRRPRVRGLASDEEPDLLGAEELAGARSGAPAGSVRGATADAGRGGDDGEGAAG